MKLPRCITIEGKRWRFVYVDKKPLYRGRRCRGLCNDATKIITIYRHQSKLALLETIYHECQHAAHFSGNFRWSHGLIYATSRPLVRIAQMMLEE